MRKQKVGSQNFRLRRLFFFCLLCACSTIRESLLSYKRTHSASAGTRRRHARQLARIRELGGKPLGFVVSNLHKGDCGGEHPLLLSVVLVINRPFVSAVEIDVGQQRPPAALCK